MEIPREGSGTLRTHRGLDKHVLHGIQELFESPELRKAEK